jgi:hypothetical protein
LTVFWWASFAALVDEATIRSFGFLDCFTLDAMQVDVIDWEEVAKAGG